VVVLVDSKKKKQEMGFIKKSLIASDLLAILKTKKLGYFGHTVSQAYGCFDIEIIYGVLSGTRKRGKTKNNVVEQHHKLDGMNFKQDCLI